MSAGSSLIAALVLELFRDVMMAVSSPRARKAARDAFLRFFERHPDLGPVPPDLRPRFHNIRREVEGRGPREL